MNINLKKINFNLIFLINIIIGFKEFNPQNIIYFLIQYNKNKLIFF